MPDLGLWRPLGNTIIEKTYTPWPNKCNDCKDMCGIIMLQLTMSRNVAATQTVLKGALHRIWCGVNRLGDSGVNAV